MANTIGRRLAMILDDEIRGPKGFGKAALAELTGIAPRSLDNWCEEVCAAPLPRVLEIIAAISVEDPPRGLRMMDRILALVGMQARPAPTVSPDAAPAALVLRVAAAEGEVAAWADKALEDGVLDQSEANAGAPKIRAARHRLDVLGSVVQGVAERGPQQAFPEVRP